jgi:hypothetical protein
MYSCSTLHSKYLRCYGPRQYIMVYKTLNQTWRPSYPYDHPLSLFLSPIIMLNKMFGVNNNRLLFPLSIIEGNFNFFFYTNSALLIILLKTVCGSNETDLNSCRLQTMSAVYISTAG